MVGVEKYKIFNDDEDEITPDDTDDIIPDDTDVINPDGPDTDDPTPDDVDATDSDDTDDINRDDEEFIVGQKMTRYFGYVLYSGEVYKIVNDKYHIVYEDDDKDVMDHDQLYYAVSLYNSEVR
jgi:hypothetical protein